MIFFVDSITEQDDVCHLVFAKLMALNTANPTFSQNPMPHGCHSKPSAAKNTLMSIQTPKTFTSSPP